MSRIRRLKPQTKYFPPELIKKLECICNYPLALLEASSGFGKTTALMHFFDTRLPKTATVYRQVFMGKGIQEEWQQFCSIIARFDKDNAEMLLDVDMPNKDTLPYIRSILHLLSCENETYIFLDDVHEWKLPHTCEFLSALSEQGAENLHIVVASHPYSRKAHEKIIRSSRLWHLQEEDFAFSRENTKRYFRQVGLLLSHEQLDEVMELTGGWIMALYLQLDSFIRKGRFEQGGMEKLMKKTFWGRLSEEEKELLMKLSIFPNFTLFHAAGFSGISPEKVENQLRERHFFIRYDNEENCYYMHTQLKKLLKSKFMLLHKDRQKEIYLKGGELAWSSGDSINAFRFYHHAGAWEAILSMLLTSYKIVEVLNEKAVPMILNVLENTPRVIKARHPKALVSLVFLLLFAGANKESLKYKDEIKEIIAENSFSEKERNVLTGELELFLSFLEYNRIGDMGKRYKKALELLDGPADLINVKSAWTFGSPSVLYLFWREGGKLDEEMIQMDESLPIYYQLTRGHGKGAELIMRAEAHLHRGETEQAERLCYRAIITANEQHQGSISQCGAFTLARLAMIKGDGKMLEESRAALKSMLRYNTEDFCRNTFALADGYLAILSGQKDRVEPWLYEGRINNRLLIMVKPFAYIIYGRILIQKKEYQKLLGISEYMMEISSAFPNLLPQVYLKIYRSQAFYSLKNFKEALLQLNEAFKLALPDRIFLPFSENYEGIKDMLADTLCCEEDRRKIEMLIYKINEGRKGQDCKIAELTPRERQVFNLLVKGMTNKQISDELYISFSAVKKHVSIILKKFAVTSREMLKEGNIKNKWPMANTEN